MKEAIICIMVGVIATCVLINYAGIQTALLLLVFLYVGLHITRALLNVPRS